MKIIGSLTKKIFTIMLSIIVLSTLLLSVVFAQEAVCGAQQHEYEPRNLDDVCEKEPFDQEGESSDGCVSCADYSDKEPAPDDDKQYETLPEREKPPTELPYAQKPGCQYYASQGSYGAENTAANLMVAAQRATNVSNFFQFTLAVMSASNSPEQVTIRIVDDIILPYTLNIPANANIRLEASDNARLRSLGGFRHFSVRGTLVITEGVTLSSSIFGYGGGVAVLSGGLLEMHGGEISGNAGFSGGGVSVDGGTFIMTGGTIARNRADGPKITTTGTLGYGGGVLVDGGVFRMYGGVIEDNSTMMHGRGGGVAVVGGGTLYMSGNAEIYNNRTLSPIGLAPSNSGQGGGVRINSGSTFNMSGNARIIGNSCEGVNAGNGGGVSVGGVFNMYGGTIAQNASGNNYANAVHFSDGGIFNLYGGLIKNNGTRHSGANAIFVYDGIFNMYGGTITDQNGAGVVVFGVANISGGYITGNRNSGIAVGGASGAELNISGDAVIHNNTTAGNGGGIRTIGESGRSTITMSGGSIRNNTATENGGGLWLGKPNAIFNMHSGSIENNTAYIGGGIYTININNLTTYITAIFSGNNALSGGRFGPENRWTDFPSLLWNGSNSKGGTLTGVNNFHLINNFDIGTNEGALYTGLCCDCAEYADCECDCENSNGNNQGGNNPGGNDPGGNDPGGNDPGGNDQDGNSLGRDAGENIPENNQTSEQNLPATEENMTENENQETSLTPEEQNPPETEEMLIRDDLVPLSETPQATEQNQINQNIIATPVIVSVTELLHVQADEESSEEDAVTETLEEHLDPGLSSEHLLISNHTNQDFRRVEFMTQEYNAKISQFSHYFGNTAALNFMGRTVPLYAPGEISMGTWALLNLVVSLQCMVLAVIYIRKAALEKKRKSKESGENKAKITDGLRFGGLVVACTAGIAAVTLFALTQDISRTMVLADGFTPVHTIILLAMIVLAAVSARRRKNNGLAFTK